MEISLIVFLFIVITPQGTGGLSVKFFKVDKSGDDNINVIIGSSVNISCGYIINNSPLPILVSVLFGKINGSNHMIQLHESKHIYWTAMECFNKLGEESQCGQDTLHVRKLQITNVTIDDGGLYSCFVAASSTTFANATFELSPKPCKSGHYCYHDNNNEQQCQMGTFNNHTGQFSSSACIICPLKHYCPSGSSYPMQCQPPRFYKQINSDDADNSTFGWKSASDCSTCPLKQRCHNSSICNFICTRSDYIEAIIGQNITLQCNITETAFMPDGIQWYEKSENGTKLLYVNESFIKHDINSSKLLVPMITNPKSVTYFCGGVENHMNTSIEKKIVVNFKDPSKVSKGIFRLWLLSIPLVLLVIVFILILISLRHRERHKMRHSSQGQAFADAEETDGYDEVFMERTSCHPLMCKIPKLDKDSTQKDDFDLATYDVFICYSAADRIWVKDTLLKELEEKGNIRACIDYRNFRIGETIINNIAEAIYQSKKTIAVLSPDFLASEFCKHELHTALSHMDNHTVIPVLYRRCDVPDVLLDKTYLDWLNHDIKPHFWKQLIKAIRRDPKINLDTDNTTA